MDFIFKIISSVNNVIVAVATIVLVRVATNQLTTVVNDNGIKIVLDLEAKLQHTQLEINKLTSEIRIKSISTENGQSLNDELKKIYSDDMQALMEVYLNNLDRLCYCVLKNYLEDRDWKSEYNDLLKDTVRKYDTKFNTGTYYKNIKKLYDKWNN